MKNYRLVSEAPDHFVIHDTNDKKEFKVAKAHLDLPMTVKLAKLQKMDEGGVSGDPNGTYDVNAPAVPPSPQYQAAPPLVNALPPNPQNDGSPGVGVYAPQAEVSVAQQAAPQPSVPIVPNQTSMPNNADELNKYLNTMQTAGAAQKSAYDTFAQQAQANADVSAKVANQTAAQLTDAQKNYDATSQALMAQHNQISQGIANNQIDPNRFWNNQGIGNKLGMLAGLLISGAGANAHQGNMAMDVINKNIDDDIKAQIANQNTKKDLLSDNNTQQQQSATQLNEARLTKLAAMKGMLDAAALKQGGQQAQLNATNAKAGIDQQMAGLTKDVAVQKMLYNYYGNPQGSQGSEAMSGINPQQLRDALNPMNPFAVPKEQQPAVMKQVDEYSQMQKKLGNVENTFQQIGTLQNFNKYNPLHPIEATEQRDKIEALTEMAAVEGAKDTTGKVNEKTYDAIKANMRGMIDSPETAEVKKNNILDAYKAQYGDFNLLKAYRLLPAGGGSAITTTGQKKAAVAGKFNKLGSTNQDYVGAP